MIALILMPLQLAAIIATYQIGIDFTCIGDAQQTACQMLRRSVGRAIAAMAVMALYAASRRRAIAALLGARGVEDQTWRPWAALQVAGFTAIMTPAAIADPASGTFFAQGAPWWLAGAAAAAAGALLWIAPPRAWATFVREDPLGLAALSLLALALPELVSVAQPLWRVETITRITFNAVVAVLSAFGVAAVTDAATYVIGVGDFVVKVGPSCSGVQGFALISVFVAIYAWIFRAETRFPHFWIMLPIGLAASWLFNVLRISALIGIGAAGAPSLAVNGFHSHAGWLFFTVLSMGVMLGARTIPWLQARRVGDSPATAARSGPPPFFEDWAAARIAPFIVFMASALVASTLVEPPSLAYPVRAALMALALWGFRRLYLRLEWRLDPVAAVGGALVGAAWLATTPPPGEADALLVEGLAALGPLALAVWVASRLIGTAMLIPLIEELFFRGYVLARLDTGGTAMRLVALAISSGLFALLHDRWLAAALAGLVFALLYLRSGRIADAVVAHAAANAIIAAWAVASGRWDVI